MGMTTLDQCEAHRRRLLIAGAAGLSDAGKLSEELPEMTQTQGMVDHSDIPDVQDMSGAAKSANDDKPSIK
jgi:hypothetical protein